MAAPLVVGCKVWQCCLKGPTSIHLHRKQGSNLFACAARSRALGPATLSRGYDTACISLPLLAVSCRSGVYNDLGSGGNVDLCIITKETTEHTVGCVSEYRRTHVYLQVRHGLKQSQPGHTCMAVWPSHHEVSL